MPRKKNYRGGPKSSFSTPGTIITIERCAQPPKSTKSFQNKRSETSSNSMENRILFVCLFVYVFVYVFVCLFMYLFIYLFKLGSHTGKEGSCMWKTGPQNIWNSLSLRSILISGIKYTYHSCFSLVYSHFYIYIYRDVSQAYSLPTWVSLQWRYLN